MLSRVARWTFALTALAPALGAAALISILQHKSLSWGVAFAVASVSTVFVSATLLLFVQQSLARTSLRIKEVEQADKHVLEFLLAYLLPVFSSTAISDMSGSLVLTIYSLAIVAFVVVNGNVFQFNPVLIFLGYHFYVVKSDTGISYLVISQKAFHTADREITCKVLGEYLRLEV